MGCRFWRWRRLYRTRLWITPRVVVAATRLRDVATRLLRVVRARVTVFVVLVEATACLRLCFRVAPKALTASRAARIRLIARRRQRPIIQPLQKTPLPIKRIHLLGACPQVNVQSMLNTSLKRVNVEMFNISTPPSSRHQSESPLHS